MDVVLNEIEILVVVWLGSLTFYHYNHRLGVLFFDIFAVQGGFRWFHVDESSLKATLD